MTRITRDRKLTAEEAAKYDAVRRQVAGELPELVARHVERAAARARVDAVLAELESARTAKGLSLPDVAAQVGFDAAAVASLSAEPTLGTLSRYADVVGKRLVVTLCDA